MNAYLVRTAAALFLISSVACTTQNRSDVVDATTTPLSDLNLVHAEIPVVLVEAQKAPYDVPRDYSCNTLESGIHDLDEVLGADLDAVATSNNPGLIERGSKVASTAAVGVLKRTAEGVVPFRGWVRKLSGAERYSNKVSAAITAGQSRRAFLKGLRASMECHTLAMLQPDPASPQ
ncbi:MAG: hypothetical protein WAW02_07295 [Sideroxyarcus sp.]